MTMEAWGVVSIADAFERVDRLLGADDAHATDVAIDLLAATMADHAEQVFTRLTRAGYSPDRCVVLGAEAVRDAALDTLDWQPQRRSIAPRIRTLVFRRDGYICVECGEDDVFKLTIDHRIAVHYGGSNEPTNLVTRCRSCNAAKGKELRD